MEKKNVLGLGLLFLALLVIGGGVYYLYTERENEIVRNQEQQEIEATPPTEERASMPYDDFFLTYEYVGDNTWDYKVTGTLPNPCYTVTFESIVMESDPEQVRVQAMVQEPSPEEICTQVIQEVEEIGTFSAGENAEILLELELQPAEINPVEQP
jgi:hypothetical protein